MDKETYSHWRAELDVCTSIRAIEDMRELIQKQDVGPVDMDGQSRYFSIMKQAGEKSDLLWDKFHAQLMKP